MSKPSIRVGDKIRFNVGGDQFIEGQIIEDRGPIGVGGRRLYGISYDLGADHPYYIEMPAVEFEVIEPKKDSR
jgi:hypothetical protein